MTAAATGRRGARRPTAASPASSARGPSYGPVNVTAFSKRSTTGIDDEHGTRVSLVLKADYRPGHTGELDGKVQRLERALADGAVAAGASSAEASA